MYGMTVRNNRGVNPYNPLHQMEELERAFLGDPFRSFFGTSALAEFRTDVTDEGDHYLLEADLPGVEKKDIQLDIQGNTLQIRAERRSRTEEKDKQDKVIRMERSYGAYARSFDISGVEAEEIKARYENGVLLLTLPKKEKRAPQARHLEIE